MCVHGDGARERDGLFETRGIFHGAVGGTGVCVCVWCHARPTNVRSDKHTPGGWPRESERARPALKRRFVAPPILTALLPAFKICNAEEHSFLLKRQGGETHPRGFIRTRVFFNLRHPPSVAYVPRGDWPEPVDRV